MGIRGKGREELGGDWSPTGQDQGQDQGQEAELLILLSEFGNSEITWSWSRPWSWSDGTLLSPHYSLTPPNLRYPLLLPLWVNVLPLPIEILIQTPDRL